MNMALNISGVCKPCRRLISSGPAPEHIYMSIHDNLLLVGIPSGNLPSLWIAVEMANLQVL